MPGTAERVRRPLVDGDQQDIPPLTVRHPNDSLIASWSFAGRAAMGRIRHGSTHVIVPTPLEIRNSTAHLQLETPQHFTWNGMLPHLFDRGGTAASAAIKRELSKGYRTWNGRPSQEWYQWQGEPKPPSRSPGDSGTGALPQYPPALPFPARDSAL